MHYKILEKTENTLHVCMFDSFTFRDHDTFFEIVNAIKYGRYSTITLDLDDVDFIDSAALGMLVIMHDELKARYPSARAILLNAHWKVKDVLYAARFDTLYEFKDTRTPSDKEMTQKPTTTRKKSKTVSDKGKAQKSITTPKKSKTAPNKERTQKNTTARKKSKTTSDKTENIISGCYLICIYMVIGLFLTAWNPFVGVLFTAFPFIILFLYLMFFVIIELIKDLIEAIR